MSAYPDTVTSAAFGTTGNLKYDPAEEARKAAAAEAARKAAELAQFEKDRATQAAVKAQAPPEEATAGPSSPVAAPSSLGTKLLEAAQSGARQSLGAELDTSRQGTGTGSFRNTTGGLAGVSGQASPGNRQPMGYGGSGIQEDVVDPMQANMEAAGQAVHTAEQAGTANMATIGGNLQSGAADAAARGVAPMVSGQGNRYADGVGLARQALSPEEAGQPGAQTNGLSNKWGVNRPAGADPANDLATPPADLPVESRNMKDLLKLVPDLALPGEAGKPIGNAPPVDYSKMTAREEAKARLHAMGKDKRTGWQKLGLALSMAAETIGAGRQNAGLTAANMKSSSPEAAEDKLTAVIQAERDRLTADNDKKRNEARQNAADARADRELGQRDVQLAQNFEVAQERARTAATAEERKAAELEVKRIVALSTARYREAMIEQVRRGAKVIPPGGVLTEKDPITGQVVSVYANELQTVTSNDTTTTRSAVNNKGEPVGTVTERKQDTTTKGYQQPGAKPRGAGAADAPSPNDEAKGVSLIQKRAKAHLGQGDDLTAAEWIEYDRLVKAGIIKQG